ANRGADRPRGSGLRRRPPGANRQGPRPPPRALRGSGRLPANPRTDRPSRRRTRPREPRRHRRRGAPARARTDRSGSMTQPRPYRYFVSYAHERGFGASEVRLDAPIRDAADVQKVQQILRDGDPRLGAVIVLYFALFVEGEVS